MEQQQQQMATINHYTDSTMMNGLELERGVEVESRNDKNGPLVSFFSPCFINTIQVRLRALHAPFSEQFKFIWSLF